MKRIFIVLFLTTVLIAACNNNDDEVESRIATGIVETLTAVPTNTPLPPGMVEIPDVIGMARDEAYELLEKLGLVPKTFWVVDDGSGYGTVTDIEPQVGEVVPVDSEVVLDVVGEVLKDKDDGEKEGCGPEPKRVASEKYKNWCLCNGGLYETGWPYPDIDGQMGAFCTGVSQ